MEMCTEAAAHGGMQEADRWVEKGCSVLTAGIEVTRAPDVDTTRWWGREDERGGPVGAQGHSRAATEQAWQKT